jgi:hypothetical protein
MAGRARRGAPAKQGFAALSAQADLGVRIMPLVPEKRQQAARQFFDRARFVTYILAGQPPSAPKSSGRLV